MNDLLAPTPVDFTIKWLKNDLKIALANSPHPLNMAVGIYKGSDSKIIGLIESHNFNNLVREIPDGYTTLSYCNGTYLHGVLRIA